MTFGVRIEGMNSFLFQLDKINKPARRRAVLRAAFRGSTAPIKKTMRRELRRQDAKATGVLVKRIREKVKTYRQGLTVFAIVGPRRGKIGSIQPTRYAHLVDKGTAPHRQTKSYFLDKRSNSWKQLSGGFRHPGAKPKPFLNAAARTAKDEVNTNFGKKFYTALARELLKQGA